MTSANEEAAFERWMLTDLDLCKDLAEFAAFALALRGGALKGAARPSIAPKPRAPNPKPVLDRRAVSARLEQPPEPDRKVLFMMIGVGVTALILVILLFVVL
jgi:hypothetical protein